MLWRRVVFLTAALLFFLLAAPPLLPAATGYTIYSNVYTLSSFYYPGETAKIEGGYFIEGSLPSGGITVQVRIYRPDGGLLHQGQTALSDRSGTFSYNYTLPSTLSAGQYTIKLIDPAAPGEVLAAGEFTVVAGDSGGGSGDLQPAKSSLEKTDSYPSGELPEKPDPVTYYEDKTLYLTTETAGGDIYYTYRESMSGFPGPADPDINATPYSKPLSLKAPLSGTRYYTIKAVVYRDGAYSAVRTFRYMFKSRTAAIVFNPEDGDDDVSVYVRPTVKFPYHVVNAGSQTIRFTEVSGGNQYVIPAKISYDRNTYTVTITPNKPLEPNKKYRITLKESIQDSSGKTLPDDVECTFRTGTENITVNGRRVDMETAAINTNRSPAEIVVRTENTSQVSINGQRAERDNDEFSLELKLKPGANKMQVLITYDDLQTRQVNFTINFFDYLIEETRTTVTLPKNGGKLSAFNNKLFLNLPPETFLFDTDYPGVPLLDQDLQLSAADDQFWGSMPNIIPLHYTVEIVPLPDRSDIDITNKGRSTITLPYYPDYSAAARGIAAVLYKPHRPAAGESAADYQILGGTVNSSARTITAPFMGFGTYAVVSMVWNFSDYNERDWAFLYVNSLWAKGVMRPLGEPVQGSLFSLQGSSRFGLRQPPAGALTGAEQAGAGAPEMPITRGEFAVMLARAFGYNIADREKHDVFSDINSNQLTARDARGNWRYIGRDYYYLAQAAKNGIIAGYVNRQGELVFDYFAYITRQQVATMLSKALQLKTETNYEKLDDLVKKLFAKDYQNIAFWAKPHVAAAATAGYFRGTAPGVFAPEQLLTRPQAARLIYVVMEKRKAL